MSSAGWLGEAGTGRSDGARGDGASVGDCIDISGFEERASRRHDQLRYHRKINTTTSGTRTCRKEDAGADATRPSLLDLSKDLSRNMMYLKHTNPVRPMGIRRSTSTSSSSYSSIIRRSPQGILGYLCFTCVLNVSDVHDKSFDRSSKEAALHPHPRPPCYTSSSRV